MVHALANKINHCFSSFILFPLSAGAGLSVKEQILLSSYPDDSVMVLIGKDPIFLPPVFTKVTDVNFE